MNKFIWLPFFLVLLVRIAAAQTPAEIIDIKLQLREIFDRDQKTRSRGDSVEFMTYIDSCNLAHVESLIEKYGWMGNSVIGEQGNITLWVVIQHAELSVQEKYLPLLKQSVEAGESRQGDLALLTDRVLMRQGKNQLYGSQVVFNKASGAPEFYPIEDEINVDSRRKQVGLEPIKKYAKSFGIDYSLPDH